MMMDLSEVLAKKYLERQEARVKLDAANEKNASLKESEEQHDVIKLQTYFGMSLITLYQNASAETILVNT
jgi:hypothetical protein